MSYLFSKRAALIILIIVFLVIIGYWILPVSIPLIIAFITAVMLEPAVKVFQRRLKIKRSISVPSIFILFLLLIAASSYFITTKVIGEAIQIIESAPSYINEINRVLLDLEQNLYYRSQDLPPEFVAALSRQVEDFLLTVQTDLAASVNIDNLKTVLTDIPNYLVSFLVYLIALFLFMIDLPNLKTRMYALLTDRTADKVNFMASRLSYVVFGFFKAQFLVSIIIFITSFIGLLFIAPDVALLMAFVIWIIDVIPIIGSIVVMGPWSLFHFITGDVVLGTKLAILGTVLLIIRRTIEPKVMGRHIGLSPLSTLIAMYLGLKLIGILGFIIGPLLLIAFNSAREAGIIKLNFKI
ncbi:sporulation integral membrane protein YtvI [Cytobacillus sp. S13-E01]|uniref:sporulation integral membrane protein YtvI n=1 Tax=Cytobacillus sp. S13-E01 TaxID=3031326 RepID=UPI0023D8C080|nr:sporulation integral membrane protein YtvI [Cytobacillus sp. S13-E01]MDF0725317.1 sporulation integral membrane protein YtvI [Cytobacillus sp. S13-E01]